MKIKHHNRLSKNGKISSVREHERNIRIGKIKDFVKKNVGKQLSKTDVIRFTVKDLGITDKDKIKKLSNLLFTKLSNDNFNKQETKSNYKYYLGSGNIQIKDFNKIERGDVFYNQRIDKDENWKKTLGRDGLVILQIDKLHTEISPKKGKKFTVKFMSPIDGGKKLKVTNKVLHASDVFNILKRGG